MTQLSRYLQSFNSVVLRSARERGRLQEIITINEYPKSGGTWLAKMVASSLDLPYEDNRRSIPLKPCVMRNHWDPRAAVPNLYLVRDGRDVMVSLFHHRIRIGEVDPQVGKAVNKIYPFELDQDKIQQQLPTFIEIELTTRTPGSPLPWHRHADAALSLGDATTIVRYEDLIDDGAQALAKALAAAFPERPMPIERVDAVVALHDRANTIESARMGNSFLRKGGSGGWREAFNAESLKVFDAIAGDTLQRLGYEKDAI